MESCSLNVGTHFLDWLVLLDMCHPAKTRYCCLGVMRETCAYEKMICNLLALIVDSGWMSGVCNCSISASDLFLILSDGREFSSPLQEAPLDCSNHLGINLSNHTRRVVSSS